MIRTPLTPFRLVAACVLIVGAAGCSSSGSGRHSVAAPSISPSSRTATAGTPLDDYLGVGRTVLSDESDASLNRKYEETIARCMATQGFEYVPAPLGSFTTKRIGGAEIVTVGKPTLPDLPPDEFAARYGYGITTAPATTKKNDPVDQNLRIVDKMSVAERVGYYHALYGTGTPLDSTGNLTNTINTSDSSCSGRAGRQMPTDAERNTTEKRVERVNKTYTSLLDRISALRDAELADPRVREATLTWSGCLTRAGFPGFNDLESPRAKILADARALLGRQLDRTTADPGAVAALRRTEIQLAVADNTCKRAWDTTFAATRKYLEARFVEDNVTELASYRSAMAAAER